MLNYRERKDLPCCITCQHSGHSQDFWLFFCRVDRAYVNIDGYPDVAFTGLCDLYELKGDPMVIEEEYDFKLLNGGIIKTTKYDSDHIWVPKLTPMLRGDMRVESDGSVKAVPKNEVSSLVVKERSVIRVV